MEVWVLSLAMLNVFLRLNIANLYTQIGAMLI